MHIDTYIRINNNIPSFSQNKILYVDIYKIIVYFHIDYYALEYAIQKI